jgi:hypothetical protein
MNALFRFEEEVGGGLRCVPMAVRLKLDRAGVKLDLKAWVKFTEAERRELLDFSGGDAAFAERTCALSRERAGEEPKRLTVPGSFPWQEDGFPRELADKALAEGVPLDGTRWSSLSVLQRFALLKLSRPSHENRNFLPACREFGLLP